MLKGRIGTRDSTHVQRIEPATATHGQGNTRTSNSVSNQVETSAKGVSNQECASRTEVSAQIVQPEESTTQNEITHTNHQLRDQDYDNEPQPAANYVNFYTVRCTSYCEAIKKKLINDAWILDLLERRKPSLITEGTEHEKVRKLLQKIDDFEKQLKHREQQRIYLIKHIKNKKENLIELCFKNSKAAKSLTPRVSFGSPPLEKEQPDLLKTIGDSAMFGASAEEQCRCEIVRTVDSISELWIVRTIGRTTWPLVSHR
ncbi:hypothetical protein EVAR_14104_1 [Eumeta japonica]|uniref:Uncharacterized protein n=1 Tax=Eumeta variegata TaxID=151549 RepID=A0A4C1UN92_EUMVA|nr:hypothetical protein EVAR_14104_1 [Eumeta japonica]